MPNLYYDVQTAIKKAAKRKTSLHKAHLANAWYPKDAQTLDTAIDEYFVLAQKHFYAEVDANSVRVLIVPHAGHHFSGLCAATAYQTLLTTKNSKDRKNKNINKVIILSPSHTKFFHGAGLPSYSSYQTPLGTLQIDEITLDLLSKEKYISVHNDAHEAEHAIEVQLPFLQKSIENFTIVPLIVGQLTTHEKVQSLSNSLKKIIDEKTLVVISTDFTHYGGGYGYTPFDSFISGQIRYIDSLAIQAISAKSQKSFEKVLRVHYTKTTICGQNPLRIMLHLLEEEDFTNIEPRLTCYYTSAHMKQARQETSLINSKKLLGTLSDKKTASSVSYVGMVFTQQPLKELSKENQLTDYEKKSLVTLSREIIENEFKKPGQRTPERLLWPIISPGLEKTSGVFVTLNSTDTGRLRGCIGQILSYNPMYKTTIKMAKAAAFKDKRFTPLKPTELNNVTIEVSVLTAPERVGSFEEVIIGTHGIILNKIEHNGSLKASAVFLPQVAKNNHWNLRTTLEQLSIKAGIGKDGWRDGAELQVFEGFEIHEDQA